jgi:glutamine amidotransferase-like uncharacterized protein
MKISLLKLASLFFLLGSSLTWAAPLREKKVLVYLGKGSCSEFCSQAAAEVPARMGLRVQYVTAEEITPAIFKDAVLWVQPGGDAIAAAQTIGAKGLRAIREFVHQGGGYVGFCAGAFMADKTIDDAGKVAGLGILPVETEDYPLDSHNGDGVMTWVNWEGHDRHLYFNGGAWFRVNPKSPEVNVLATYLPGGEPATIETKFGNGHVLVTGAHPEATYVWKGEVGLVDQDGPDYDLAAEMITKALPH